MQKSKLLSLGLGHETMICTVYQTILGDNGDISIYKLNRRKPLNDIRTLFEFVYMKITDDQVKHIQLMLEGSINESDIVIH